MAIQLRIKHTTGWRYADGASAGYHEARLLPLTTTEQYVLRSRIDVSPTAWSTEYRDYWGATVTAFEIHETHDVLTVVATSTVESSAPGTRNRWASWDDVAAVEDEWCEYVALNDDVDPSDDTRAALATLREAAATPAEYVTAVLPTLAGGTPSEVAHALIGALRVYRIPARYVAGYVHPSEDPAVGEAVAAEPSAWVEWWDTEWVGLDPATGEVPGERHVVVARGRDSGDVPSLRGIHAADGDVESFSSVEITRLR